MEINKKIDFVRTIIDQSDKNLFKMELDLRFYKRQLHAAKGDAEINLSKEIVKMENVIKGEKMYQEYLQEIMQELFSSLPKV